MANKKYKIGIFGPPIGDMQQVLPKATQLGKLLGQQAELFAIITGACTGFPYVVAKEASKAGSEVIGFSPVFNIEEQKLLTPDDDITIYSQLVFMPRDFAYADNRRICFKYRNVISTASCDAGIIISGRWGSLNEFTNLVDMQKVVGVLTGTGGIADELPDLTQKISKEGQGPIVFDDDPKKLLQKITDLLNK